jgi:LmbE family N-acetylglucosaminyl deacetylase
MHELGLTLAARTRLRILCLGAHSDDIEIGCGGSLLELLDRGSLIEVEWVIFSADGKRASEAKRSARSFLSHARKSQVTIQRFRDGYFPYQGAAIKNVFEQLKTRVTPDLVFTHYRHDRHQDHRLISDLTWNTFRNHLVLEYEIPKYDGDLGAPNCFIPLSRRTCSRKLKHLHDAFGSQRQKDWFTPETFLGLMRLRGMECRAGEGYAEAFYGRKIVL